MYNVYDCQANAIQGYEQTGHYLAKIIPAGSKIYWENDGVVCRFDMCLASRCCRVSFLKV